MALVPDLICGSVAWAPTWRSSASSGAVFLALSVTLIPFVFQ